MRRLRRIKILATLGPASSDSATIRKLFEAGADVFRINMSHTPHDKMRELIATIRNVEGSYGRPIGILVDLQGPKLRLGAFAEGAIQLNNGESITLDLDPTPGNKTRVQLPHPEILKALRPGHALLIDDGKLRLIAEETSPDHAVVRAVVGGRMSDRKGVSLPDTDLPMSAMTPKDRADLEAALEAGIDWVALSFVQRADDVLEAKKLVRGRAAVMSKIEKPQAIDRLADIIEASDALMVARGDLGVEMPVERVPGLQKQMTRMARRAGKPVVVATQMLESMIQSPVPTRAEVSDVATAVFEGADAIMLSAESAAGKFPVEAVMTMDRIGEEVERDPTYDDVIAAQRPEPEPSGDDDDPIGLMRAAARIAATRAAEAAAREATVLYKLNEGLKRSSSRLAEGLSGLTRRKLDRDALDELEDLLITSDMGAKVAARITRAIAKDRFDREITGAEIRQALANELAAILRPREKLVDFSDGPRPRIAQPNEAQMRPSSCASPVRSSQVHTPSKRRSISSPKYVSTAGRPASVAAR